MHCITAITLLSSAALTTAQYAYARAPLAEYKGGDYPGNYPQKRQFVPSGTAGGLATGTFPTGFNPTGGAVTTNIVFTTQVIVTDIGDGTMIYNPVVTLAPGQNSHYANGTAPTLIPAQSANNGASKPTDSCACPTGPGTNGAASNPGSPDTGVKPASTPTEAASTSTEPASMPEPYLGSAGRSEPSSMTPYVSTLAALALFALLA